MMGRKHKLGDLDSNQDKQYQKLLCYRYTIAQRVAVRSYGVEARPPESPAWKPENPTDHTDRGSEDLATRQVGGRGNSALVVARLSKAVLFGSGEPNHPSAGTGPAVAAFSPRSGVETWVGPWPRLGWIPVEDAASVAAGSEERG